MDPADGLPQRLAVARPHAGTEAPSVAAPAPLLGRPILLDVLLGVCGARPEEPRQHGEDKLLAFLGWELSGPAGVPALHEAEERPAAKVGWRVVEDDAHLVVEAEDRSGEPRGAPEGLGVGDLHLCDVAHGHLLGELIP